MPYDLVTIGGGFSGLVSAARAAELGLKVVVLEARAEDRYPCSSRYTTGVSNVMGLAILADPDVLYQAIIDGSGGTANPALARAVADNGKRAIDWLAVQGARFITRALQKDQPGQKVLARVGPGANGDGIRLAEAAGAAIGGFGAFYGHVHHRAAMQSPRLWPYPHLDAVAEVALLVGPDGRRFTDEGLGGVCQANAIARLADPLSAHLIMDDAMWHAEPKLTTTVAANSAMVTAGGALISAPDLDALAAKVGVPASALADT